MRANTLSFHHNFTLPRRFFTGAMIFTAAYFVTISVNAQQPATQSTPAEISQTIGGE